MWRTIRGVLGVLGSLEAAACGGEAIDVGDSAPPPFGFYTRTRVITEDTCSPSETARADELTGGNSAVVNVNLWSGLRSDIPWSTPTPVEIRCGDSEETKKPFFHAVYEALPLNSRSFQVLSTITWDDPTACDYPDSVVVPSAPCSVERTDTFELIAACPATRNNVSCPAPSPSR